LKLTVVLLQIAETVRREIRKINLTLSMQLQTVKDQGKDTSKVNPTTGHEGPERE
jgi:hypothetical protein